MTKRTMAMALVLALGVTTLAGCGGAKKGASSDTGKGSAEGATELSEYVSSEEEGKVINIWIWNEEFQTRFNEHYPEVKEASKDGTTTTLKDGTTVRWITNPNQQGVYQDELDEAILNQDSADPDDRVDMFLAEIDYLAKYIDPESDVAIPLESLGIDPDKDLADQYQYTRDATSSKDGLQRASTWQCTPGLFLYRRSIAKEVLGTDDPDEVGGMISDWEKYGEVAKQMKDKGYYMSSSFADNQRVYINNISRKWVEDGSTTVNVDQNVVNWINDTKAGLDNGYIHTTEGLWTDTWNKDQGADSKVFGFFGPAWLINFTIEPNYGKEAKPDWAVCNPSQEYYRGGSFLLACRGTDNPEHVKDIILKMTADKDVLLGITKDYTEFTNTKSGMQELAADDSFGSDFLCGQNPYKYYEPACEKISDVKISPYDQGCVEGLSVFTDYFNDKVSYEEAKENFNMHVMERYPDITEVVWPDE